MDLFHHGAGKLNLFWTCSQIKVEEWHASYSCLLHNALDGFLLHKLNILI